MIIELQRFKKFHILKEPLNEINKKMNISLCVPYLTDLVRDYAKKFN